MPNLLILSENKVFADDLRAQIKLYAPDFTEDENLMPDVIILDDLPTQIVSCRAQHPQVPLVAFLTPNNENLPEMPLVYIKEKPLDLEQIIDQLNAVINLAANSAAGILKFNRYELYPLKKEICNRRNNVITKLTEKEAAILQYLYKIKDRVVTKSELLENVWGYSPEAATHTIETHIYRMRQKIEGDDSGAQLILTENGGYILKR